MKKILFLMTPLFLLNAFSYSQENGKVSQLPPFPEYYWYGNYNQLKESEINIPAQYGEGQAFWNPNVFKMNNQSVPNKIGYYTSGYYKKWEAEEDVHNLQIGMKHDLGKKMEVDGTICWGVIEDSGKGQLLIAGPHYSQDKAYRQYYMSTVSLIYEVRFKIKLLNPVDSLTEVCKIQPALRYAYTANNRIEYSDLILNSKTVLGKDLSTDEFKYLTIKYTYPEALIPSYRLMYPSLVIPEGFNDKLPGTGIQFNLQLLGEGRIAVDYIEVYDVGIWDTFISDPLISANEIRTVAGDPDFTGIQYLNYSYSEVAPLSIDSYEPYRVVDSILTSIPGGKPLITIYNNHPPIEVRKENK